MTAQLKPWQRIPHVSCERCPSPATRRVIALAQEVYECEEHGHVVVALSYDAATAAALACATHSRVIGAQFCRDYGAATGMPLRMTWWFWISCYVVAPFLYWLPMPKWMRR